MNGSCECGDKIWDECPSDCLYEENKRLREQVKNLTIPVVIVPKGTLCDKCYDTDGFYLGTTCPKCNEPFRSVKA